MLSHKKKRSTNLAWTMDISFLRHVRFFLLATKTEASYLTSVSLSFLISKMGVMVSARRIK